jgi:hypothetical protein
MAFPTDTMRVMATSDEWDFTKTPTIVPTGGAELTTAADDGAPAFTGASITVNNGGWAFAETDGVASADNLRITTGMLGDHGFAEAVLPSNNDGWAFAETNRAMEDGGWAFADELLRVGRD